MPASREFWDMVSGGASSYERCEECGRTVYVANEDGSPVEGIPAAEKDEQWVPDFENDGIFHCYFMGRHLVYGCPCDAAGRLEAYLIANAEDMATFLRMLKAKREAQAAAIDIEG